jgi:uncharacterized membrane protein
VRREEFTSMTAETNVGSVERWTSALGGAVLATRAVKQLRDDHPLAGALLAAAGGTLIYRGGTGHCPAYAAGPTSAWPDRATPARRWAVRGAFTWTRR